MNVIKYLGALLFIPIFYNHVSVTYKIHFTRKISNSIIGRAINYRRVRLQSNRMPSPRWTVFVFLGSSVQARRRPLAKPISVHLGKHRLVRDLCVLFNSICQFHRHLLIGHTFLCPLLICSELATMLKYCSSRF